MNKIKELRKEKNITVAELAKELGISQSMLTNYENGNGTPRDESIWEKLSQIFGVSKSHVMGLTTDIKITNEAKRLKIVVDMSQPVSIQPKNQTDLDVLMKLNLLDSDDMEEVLEFLNKLLSKEKYQGRKETSIDYVVG
nr:helix-turn-helix transcriptional regulator [uncultured Sellimonas sp.]